MLTYLLAADPHGEIFCRSGSQEDTTGKSATDSETRDTSRPINGVAASVAMLESMCRTGRRPPSRVMECSPRAIRPMIRLTTIAHVGGPVGTRGSIYGSSLNSGYAGKLLLIIFIHHRAVAIEKE